MEDYNLLANLRGWRTSRCVTPLDGARTPVGDAPFDMFGSGGCSSGGFCSGLLCHGGKQHVRRVRSRVSTVRAAADLFDGEEGIVPSVSSRSRPRMKQGRSPRQPERTMPSVAVRRTAPVLCLRAPSASAQNSFFQRLAHTLPRQPPLLKPHPPPRLPPSTHPPSSPPLFFVPEIVGGRCEGRCVAASGERRRS